MVLKPSGVARIFRIQGHEGGRTFSSGANVEDDRNFSPGHQLDYLENLCCAHILSIFHRRVRYCSLLFVTVRHCSSLFVTVPNSSELFFFLNFNAILRLLKKHKVL